MRKSNGTGRAGGSSRLASAFSTAGRPKLRDWTLLAWTDASDSIFRDWRAQRVRIGKPDLRIASVALSLDAVVLSRNLRDFRQAPRLRVENWLD